MYSVCMSERSSSFFSFSSALFCLSFRLNSLLLWCFSDQVATWWRTWCLHPSHSSITNGKCHQKELLFLCYRPPFIHLRPSPSHSPSHLIAFDLSFHFLSPTTLPPSSRKQSDRSSFSGGVVAPGLICGISLLESCHVERHYSCSEILQSPHMILEGI